MKIIKPRIIIFNMELAQEKICNIEKYGRICYKSGSKINIEGANTFVRKLIANGHESVIEHEKATIQIITDRGVSHEIVRHRIASYSQESTRYCNYANEKFGNEITVVEPFFYKLDSDLYSIWKNSCKNAEEQYINLLKSSSPQEARSVLPNSLKTEIIVTFNFREWRHFFRLRCSKKAHPQMRQISIPLLLEFRKRLPVLFEDIEYDKEFNANDYAEIEIL